MKHRSVLVCLLCGSAALALAAVAWMSPLALRRGGPARAALALEEVVAEVEAGRRATPLVGEPGAGGDAPVTFLARSRDGRAPRIVSDVTGWGEHIDGTFDFTAGTMTRVGRTEWFSLQANVAPRARIEYLIAYGLTDYQVDPHNPRQTAGPQLGGIRASELVMPGYLMPQEFADPPAAATGLTAEASVESRVTLSTWRVIVYTPPGYSAGGTYPVAVFLDLRSGQVSRVLDWAIAHRAIEPVVAVFVGPKAFGEDHISGQALRTFVTRELPAWMRSRYGVSRSPGSRAILGISFGAKDALDLAVSSGAEPDGFGLVGLLVPGRRIGRADLEAIVVPRSHHLRVAILAGQYDQANRPTARAVRQALIDAGDTVAYTEVPEGHSAVTWTYHLLDVLVGLFGR